MHEGCRGWEGGTYERRFEERVRAKEDWAGNGHLKRRVSDSPRHRHSGRLSQRSRSVSSV